MQFFITIVFLTLICLKVREQVMSFGHVPVFVKPGKKLNANFFDRLVAEGITTFVDIRNVDLVGFDLASANIRALSAN